MSFDFHVHGLWIIGAIMLFLSGFIAGNIQWVEGTTDFSFYGSVLIAFILFLVAGACWISAAVNAREEQR
ncbi:MAG: hypothetical protein QXD48_03505 [Candidatus Aenigmatarchaeota archaeon]